MSSDRSPATPREPPHIPIATLGLGLGAFFAASLTGCVVLGLVVPDAGLHRPWLQFFPWFDWGLRGFVTGLVWTQVYAWWTALVFGSSFNFFASWRK